MTRNYSSLGNSSRDSSAQTSEDLLRVERILPYSRDQLFNMVADIESYPRFLPGWQSARITHKEHNRYFATQRLGFRLLSIEFSSVAMLEPPEHIHISTSRTRFDALEIDWRFTRLTEYKTRVSLTVSTARLAFAQHPVLSSALYSASSLLDYFAQRARLLYGNDQATKAS